MRFLHAPSGSLEIYNTMRGKDDESLQVDPVLEAEPREVVRVPVKRLAIQDLVSARGSQRQSGYLSWAFAFYAATALIARVGGGGRARNTSTHRYFVCSCAPSTRAHTA